ncbi:hypothetical protein [Pseudomonas ovata]|uniref:hypothetical protein n=1 Tax=Pseudomonas ovata TaxID=1839709 RepID=UPI000D691596|nr:hypothetical protein [Pseudomonas ovata]
MDRKLNKAIKHYYRSGSLAAMTDPELINLLHINGMIVPAEDLTHDELIKKLFHEKGIADQASVVASFLIGLENGLPEKRAALSAYAIMLNFPAHGFESTHGIQCDVCGVFKNRSRDFTLCNLARYSVGATYSGAPEQLYVFLREHNKTAVPAVQSVSMLKDVLSVLRAADLQDRPVTLEKKLRAIPGIGMDKEQSRALLDLLGHLGVLETPEHKGFVHHYTYIGLAPRKSHSSDWSYPVDFWTGKDGVNEEAVEFWFSDYL